MTSLSPLQRNPTPNTVAPAFRGALAHMNADHKHHLRLIVSHHLSLSRPPSEIHMTKMDERGFEVEYKVLSSFWKPATKKGVRIPWQDGVVVKEGKDTRQLLVKLSEQAEKVKSKEVPIVYSLPPELPLSILLAMTLQYLASPRLISQLPSGSSASATYLYLRKALRLEVTIPWLLQAALAAHVLEAAVLFGIVFFKRRGGLVQAVLWAITTIPTGFPTFARFKRLNPTWDQGGSGKAKSH